MRSVVLAAFEGERYIDDQLDSIASQLAADDEVIVSDDASSDGTVTAVMRRSDARIRVVRNSVRVGYIKNFERAVACARGDYIFFSDQDDVWLPNKMAAVCAALARKSCVVSDAMVVDSALNLLDPSFFKLRHATDFSWTTVFVKPCFIGATMACRRDYLDALLPFPKGVPHDFWITINAAWDKELEIIEEPLILYRRHRGAASVSATAGKRSMLTIAEERARLAAAFISRRTRRALRSASARGLSK